MRDAVRDAFYDFNARFEGDINYFYQDVLGLVSIGVGILTDPLSLALALNLPLVHIDGTPASRNDVIAEWTKIKALGSGDHTDGNPAARGGHLYAKPHTRLRMTQEGVRMTLERKLVANDDYLKKRFPDFESWPADAQMAIHSLAWGCGPAFRFPKLEAHLKALDFRSASTEVRMVANGVELYGLKPRNTANRILLTNAAVVHQALDPNVLYYPTDLDKEPVDKDADTIPEVVPEVRPSTLESRTVIDFAKIRPTMTLDELRGMAKDDDDEPNGAA